MTELIHIIDIDYSYPAMSYYTWTCFYLVLHALIQLVAFRFVFSFLFGTLRCFVGALRLSSGI